MVAKLLSKQLESVKASATEAKAAKFAKRITQSGRSIKINGRLFGFIKSVSLDNRTDVLGFVGKGKTKYRIPCNLN